MTVRGAGSLCVCVLLWLSVCVSVPAGAQSVSVTVPARDRTGTAPTSGTAVLRGRVVSADGSSALRRAQVRIAGMRMVRLTSTDAEGRYEFANLGAGRYTITVNKAGYVGLAFGQRRPFEGGRPLDLADGQVVENIDFALPPGGVIAGRITDEAGDPIVGAYVQAMRYMYTPGGRRQLVGANPSYLSNLSNDLGEFRLFGLMPGAYVVSAHSSSAGVVSLTQSGRQTGGVVSINARDGLLQTYFPGTANVAEAQPVLVNLSEEAHASFALVSGRMNRITGFARRSDGRPATGSEIQLRPNDGDREGSAVGGWGMSAIAPDGQFSFANVPPGQYFLEVFPTRGTISPADAARSDAPIQEFARSSVTVGGEDIAGLSIVTRPAVSASGRVLLPRAGLKNADGSPLRMNAIPSDPSQRGRMSMTPVNNGVLDESGHFQIRGIVGQVLFRNGMFPPGFGVTSVRLGGADITDQPYDSNNGDVTGLEIVIGEMAQISGTARNARGEPMKDFKVALFPAGVKPSLRTQRFMSTATADPTGHFQIPNLAEGEYLIVAVESFDRGEEWDPAFQQRVLPAARRVAVKEGQILTVDAPYVE